MFAAPVLIQCFPERVGPAQIAGLVSLLVGSVEAPVPISGFPVVVVVMGSMRHRSR